MRIKYKAEGDGFQVDAICERGYTIAYIFRHDRVPALNIPDAENLSALHRRSLYLFSLLKYAWCTVWFDNLYTSARFLRVAFNDFRVMGGGVCRKGGRGFPACIFQEEVTRKEDLDATQGTVKVAFSGDRVARDARYA